MVLVVPVEEEGPAEWVAPECLRPLPGEDGDFGGPEETEAAADA